MNKKVSFFFGVGLVCSFLLPGIAQTEDSPLPMVQESIDQIIEILNSSEYSQDKPKGREKIFSLVDERFSWEEIGKRSLGRLWKEQTVEDQQKYVSLFAQLLRKIYIDKVEGYAGEKVIYDEEILKGEYAEVRTSVTDQAGIKIPIFYRLLKKDNSWQVYDVVIEGVSLVKNYRSQFEEILSAFSFSELLKKIEEKIKEQEES